VPCSICVMKMHKTTNVTIETKALHVIWKYPGGGGGGGGGLIKLEMFVTKDLSRSIVGNSVVFKLSFLSINQIICEVNLLSVRSVKLKF
jgi:hypothetical protein